MTVLGIDLLSANEMMMRYISHEYMIATITRQIDFFSCVPNNHQNARAASLDLYEKNPVLKSFMAAIGPEIWISKHVIF